MAVEKFDDYSYVVNTDQHDVRDQRFLFIKVKCNKVKLKDQTDHLFFFFKESIVYSLATLRKKYYFLTMITAM